MGDVVGWLEHKLLDPAQYPFDKGKKSSTKGAGGAAPAAAHSSASGAASPAQPAAGTPALPAFLGGLPDSSDEPSFSNFGLYGVDESMFGQRVGQQGSQDTYSHGYNPYEREGHGVTFAGQPTFELPTIGEVLQALAGLPEDSLGDLQAKLLKAGFYSKSTKAGDITLGQADELTYDAFTRLLMRTARKNNSSPADQTTWQGLLDDTIATNEKTGAEPGPLIELTDPAALRAIAKQTAQQLYGKVSDSDLTRFVAMFHGMQSAAQSRTSGTVVTPNAQAEAEQFLTGAHPGETGTYQAATTYYDAAIKTLGLGGVAGGS